MHALDLPPSRWYPTTDGLIYADKVPHVRKEPAAPKAFVAPSVERMVAISAAGYEDPPNGGLMAWLQVAGSFFLFFNSWYDIL